MQATGIVRRVDDLGRIVIPKEIRHKLCITEGSALELFLDDNGVCFKKYSPEYSSLIADVVHIMQNDGSWKDDERYLLLIGKLTDIIISLSELEGE